MVLAATALLLGQLTAKRDGWWDISVRYPRFSAVGGAARAANAEAARRERKEFREFLADAKKDMPDLKKAGAAGSYELEIKAHRIADRPGLASGYAERYDYRAGAHGTTSYETINFGTVRGNVRPLRLRDLFLPGTAPIAQCSRSLIATWKKNGETPSMVSEGQWKGLTPEEAERFAVGKLGILFLFGSYELGAYAEGTRQTLVPWSALKGVDRKALAPVLGA